MRGDLDQARDLAHSLRFRAEELVERPKVDRQELALRRGRRLGLEVSSELTPRLAAVVTSVCSNFGLAPERLRTFVHPSADLQALCSIAEGRCLIELSSSLVEQLDDQEQAFVIGHELGHFLLDHHYLPLPSASSIEKYELLRAREISADRLGLVACRSPEAAIRAIIKTFSGLSESYLRFDAAAFLRSSFDGQSRAQLQAGFRDTHPSFAIRARCLVHFAPVSTVEDSQSWKVEFDRAEDRIFRDFVTYSEASVIEHVKSLETSFGQWIWVLPPAFSGSISKDQLAVIENKFGAQFADSIKRNFSGMPRKEVALLAEQKLKEAFAECRIARPAKTAALFHRLVVEAESSFGLPPGSHPAITILQGNEA